MWKILFNHEISMLIIYQYLVTLGYLQKSFCYFILDKVKTLHLEILAQNGHNPGCKTKELLSTVIGLNLYLKTESDIGKRVNGFALLLFCTLYKCNQCRKK